MYSYNVTNLQLIGSSAQRQKLSAFILDCYRCLKLGSHCANSTVLELFFCPEKKRDEKNGVLM